MKVSNKNSSYFWIAILALGASLIAYRAAYLFVHSTILGIAILCPGYIVGMVAAQSDILFILISTLSNFIYYLFIFRVFGKVQKNK